MRGKKKKSLNYIKHSAVSRFKLLLISTYMNRETLEALLVQWLAQ